MSNKKKVAEEYCWAITQDAVWTCCSQSGSSALEFEFKLSSHYIYIHTRARARAHTHTHTQTPVHRHCLLTAVCGVKSKYCIIGGFMFTDFHRRKVRVAICRDLTIYIYIYTYIYTHIYVCVCV